MKGEIGLNDKEARAVEERDLSGSGSGSLFDVNKDQLGVEMDNKRTIGTS